MCPGAPFLIPGTADRINARLPAVADACRDAVADLPGADSVLLITAAPSGSTIGDSAEPAWRELPPGIVISSSPLRRSDLPRTRPVATAPAVGTDSVGTMVGAALLAGRTARSITPVTSPSTATVVEIVGDPAAVAAMLTARCAGEERIALLVIADGSACHGDDAPGRRDDRAAGFDAMLADALASGDPQALQDACADPDLARELLAGVAPLAVLALLTADHPPTAAELLYSGAPLGVGYLVASWRWGAR